MDEGFKRIREAVTSFKETSLSDEELARIALGDFFGKTASEFITDNQGLVFMINRKVASSFTPLVLNGGFSGTILPIYEQFQLTSEKYSTAITSRWMHSLAQVRDFYRQQMEPDMNPEAKSGLDALMEAKGVNESIVDRLRIRASDLRKDTKLRMLTISNALPGPREFTNSQNTYTTYVTLAKRVLMLKEFDSIGMADEEGEEVSMSNHPIRPSKTLRAFFVDAIVALVPYQEYLNRQFVDYCVRTHMTSR